MSECLIAQGSTIIGGYVQVYEPTEGRMYLAHRLAWRRAHGEIPKGQFVCHHCDTPACWNVEHLFLGTHAENMADMVRKGRQSKPGLAQTCAKGHQKRMYASRWRCPTCHRESAKRVRRLLAPSRRMATT